MERRCGQVCRERAPLLLVVLGCWALWPGEASGQEREGAPDAAPPAASSGEEREGAPDAAPPAASSGEEREGAPLDEARLRAAMVEYRTAWRQGFGFLVGDRRTVVAAGLRGGSRRITVRLVDDDAEVVRVARVLATPRQAELDHSDDGSRPLVVLHLERELAGTPLPVSSSPLALDDQVWAISFHGPEPSAESLELSSTRITAVSPTTAGLGIPRYTTWVGSPVVNRQGAVVAFQGDGGRAPLAAEVLDVESLQEHRRIVQPLMSFRMGTELGGSQSYPFVLEVELGLTLWDQLGISLRVGGTIDAAYMRSIAATEDHGEGTVNTSSSTLTLALEARYRLQLRSGRFPISLDFVGGVQYAATFLESTEPAFYATEPGCELASGQCAVTVGDAPADETEHGIGATMGLDLRIGWLLLGYRFAPGALSWNLPTTHRLTFGFAF